MNMKKMKKWIMPSIRTSSLSSAKPGFLSQRCICWHLHIVFFSALFLDMVRCAFRRFDHKMHEGKAAKRVLVHTSLIVYFPLMFYVRKKT